MRHAPGLHPGHMRGPTEVVLVGGLGQPVGLAGGLACAPACAGRAVTLALTAAGVVEEKLPARHALARSRLGHRRSPTKPSSATTTPTEPTLLKCLMAGDHCLHGFTNRNIRSNLKSTRLLSSCADDPKKAIAKFGRCFRRPLARPDCQDPAHSPPESHQLRPQRHGHLAVPARAPLPKHLLRRDTLIFFARNNELTEKKNIPRQVSITSAHRSLWAPSSSLASGLAADARINGCPRRGVTKRARSGSPS